LSSLDGETRPSWLPELPLVRRREGRVVTGLAAGIADRVGIDPVFVRAAFVVLAFCGGVGAVLYLAGWVLTPDAPIESGDGVEGRRLPATPVEHAGLGLAFLGLLLFLRTLGVWFGDALVWPVALVSLGFALTWSRSDPAGRMRWARVVLPNASDDRLVMAIRLLLGGLLIFTGLGLYAAVSPTLRSIGNVVLAVVVTLAGVMLVAGPWMMRLVTDLGRERRERIRSEERAEVAAHLHDSVLQTLALIQRTDDPKRMTMLARSQERELRGWLYGQAPTEGEDLLSTAIEAVATRVEHTHHVAVEVVTVGDRPMDGRMLSLVRAVGEAATNAAKHSGAAATTIFVEVAGGDVDVYVTDQGEGFDPVAVPEDRRGIAESIVARMRRHGGSADIESVIGEGTEVHLRMPGEVA
jgi:signal transduction histidine kinase/phage shock protein PspC (stress-responsive transcriptional regulator)